MKSELHYQDMLQDEYPKSSCSEGFAYEQPGFVHVDHNIKKKSQLDVFVAPDSGLVFKNQTEVYRTSSKLLKNTEMTAMNRQRLKSWLMSVTGSAYYRQTYALASRYIDMFLMKNKILPKSDFQIMGLGCLMLAAKMEQKKIPDIQFSVFNRKKIMNMEIELVLCFGGRLNPPTYVNVALQLFTEWDNYSRKNTLPNSMQYWQESKKSIQRCRRVFQTLDAADLICYSLDFPMNNLVWQTFYQQHRINCLLGQRESHPDFNLVQDCQFRTFHTKYSQQMQKFKKQIEPRIPQVLSESLSFNVTIFVQRLCGSMPNPKVKSSKKIKQAILVQTYNPEISRIARSILRRST